MRIGATVGNAAVIVFWGAVGFLLVFGGLNLLATANVPILSPASKAVVGAFHFSAQAI